MAPAKREVADAGGGGVGVPPGVVVGGCDPPSAGAGAAGTAGVASPSAAGRARSMRFSSDMCEVLPSAACEESALGGLIGLVGGRALTGKGAGQGDEVA